MNLTLSPSAQKTFTAVGDYGYHCNIHGGNPGARTECGGSCTSSRKGVLLSPSVARVDHRLAAKAITNTAARLPRRAPFGPVMLC